MEGPVAVPIQQTSARRGRYSYSYCVRDAGTYTVSALVGGCHLAGSPAQVVVSTADACAQLCLVKGTPPLHLNTVGGALRRGKIENTRIIFLVHLPKEEEQQHNAGRNPGPS